jgi:hypothetical protein
MTTLIYRIEKQDGNGPYASRSRVDWGLTAPYEDRHPGPMSDPLLRQKWTQLKLEYEAHLYSFGFKDEEQLRVWFYDKEWLQAMKAVGLRLTLWEVQDGFFHIGDTQAVFRKDKAILIQTSELI